MSNLLHRPEVHEILERMHRRADEVKCQEISRLAQTYAVDLSCSPQELFNAYIEKYNP